MEKKIWMVQVMTWEHRDNRFSFPADVSIFTSNKELERGLNNRLMGWRDLRVMDVIRSVSEDGSEIVIDYKYVKPEQTTPGRIIAKHKRVNGY